MKDFRSYIRYPAWLVGDLVSTPLWFFFLAVGVTLFAPTTQTSVYHGFSYFFFGFIFIVLFSTTIWGTGQSVRNEQTAGTLEQFFLAPANRLTLILGRWARIFVTDLLVIGYTTVLLYLFGGGPLSLYEPALFTFALALFEIGSIGFRSLICRFDDEIEVLQHTIQSSVLRLHDSHGSPFSGYCDSDAISIRISGNSIYIFHRPNATRGTSYAHHPS